MKIQSYGQVNGDVYRRVPDPTPEERLNFFETILRNGQAHDRYCASHSPDVIPKGLFGWRVEFIDRSCDCWISEPFGSVGLRLDA